MRSVERVEKGGGGEEGEGRRGEERGGRGERRKGERGGREGGEVLHIHDYYLSSISWLDDAA